MRSTSLAAIAAMSLIVGTSAASAQIAPQAQAPAAQVERAGAPLADAADLRGTTGWIIGAIVIGLLIWGGIELLGDDDEAFPVSP